MKRYILVVGVLCLVCLTAPLALAADVTGTVRVSGSVAPKCVVTGAGDEGAGGSTFGDSIGLGELSGNDGTLKTVLSGSTAASPAGGIIKAFRVNCNIGAPAVTLNAAALNTVAPAATGYTNTINYVAGLDLDLANTSTAGFTYNTATGVGTGTTPVASALKNAANNVRVKVYGLNTGSGDLLVAGNYAGVISVNINND